VKQHFYYCYTVWRGNHGHYQNWYAVAVWGVFYIKVAQCDIINILRLEYIYVLLRMIQESFN